jgi:hypothetical protein
MRLSIDIPDDLHRRVKAKSAQEGQTISAVSRNLLEQWAATVTPTGTTKEEWDDSLAAIRSPGVPMSDDTITAEPLPPAKAQRMPRSISKSDQAKGKSRK